MVIEQKQSFRRHLSVRAEAAGVAIARGQEAQLEAYFELLKRWNRRVNLTAFSLDNPTDAAIDRLFIEPLAAARALGDHFVNWFDFGSGGGSPAIPMKTAWPGVRLTMVESKSRKAAFLREAIRELAIANATVSELRFEALSCSSGAIGSADLVTVRAVASDAALFEASYSILQPGGILAIFGPGGGKTRLFDAPEDRTLVGDSSLSVQRKRMQ